MLNWDMFPPNITLAQDVKVVLTRHDQSSGLITPLKPSALVKRFCWDLTPRSESMEAERMRR
jgi:hypothetical protein